MQNNDEFYFYQPVISKFKLKIILVAILRTEKQPEVKLDMFFGWITHL